MIHYSITIVIIITMTIFFWFCMLNGVSLKYKDERGSNNMIPGRVTNFSFVLFSLHVHIINL